MALFVVATPIGNWDDITYRALTVLKDAAVIACEDTRETKKLLEHFGVDYSDKQLLSYHAQSGAGREDTLFQILVDGGDIVLVSDRGTPGISDPGSRLIRRAVDASVSVVPVPGASGVVTALQAAGVDTTRFEFLGFVPHKKGRQTLFEYILAAKHTVLFYESPHRILKALEALRECPRRIVVCRELTKTYEEFVHGTGAEVYADFVARDETRLRGEFIVVVDAA